MKKLTVVVALLAATMFATVNANAQSECYKHWLTENVGWYIVKFTNNCDTEKTFYYKYRNNSSEEWTYDKQSVAPNHSGVPGHSQRGKFEYEVYKVE